ncbi:hypothetical protein ACWFR1_00050 [Streptomyces sp. NPDC055103]
MAVKAIEKYTGANLMGTEVYEAALAAARIAEPHAALTDASAHILAITEPSPLGGTRSCGRRAGA